MDLTYFYIALIFGGVLLFVMIRSPRHRYRQLTHEGWKKQQLGDFEGALKDYEAALYRNSAYSYAHFNRGYIYLYQGKFDEAQQAAAQIIQIYPKSYLGYTLLADIYSCQKNYAAALAEYTRTLSLKMNDSERAHVYMRQGYALLSKYDAEKNPADIDSAAESFMSSLYAKHGNDCALAGHAQTLVLKGDYEAAVKAFTNASRLHPSSAMMFLGRGSVYSIQGKTEAALADYATALRLRPSDGMAYNNRGYLHSVLGNLDQALADCDQAIKISPSNVYAYGSRGHTYFLIGRYPEALADFQKALEIKHDHKFALAGAAIVQHALGNLEAAKSHWQALVALDSEYLNPKTLKTEFQCADAFAEAAQAVAAL